MPEFLVATASVPILEGPEEGSPLVTEVVAGERVGILEGRDGWLRVVVPGHATRLDGRGYPGWARSEGLSRVVGWEPDLVIVAGNSAGLPLGARLRGDGDVARLPGGGAVEVEPDSLRPVGDPVRGSPVELASRLLGLPYRWGGTDSTTGMDCSGLVFRVMGLLGVTLPRDAGDQFGRAPFKSRGGWKDVRRGDLVFFGEASVTHVGFYLGDGTYLSEHGSAGAVVRGMEEDPYWGFARYP